MKNRNFVQYRMAEGYDFIRYVLMYWLMVNVFVLKEGIDSKTEKNEEAEGRTADEDPESYVVCKRCRNLITSKNQAMKKDSRHEHTLFNPHGNVFTIGCFATARGCIISGRSTDEFSWFKGYFWRYASCGNCHEHLGWYFHADGGQDFFGLILNTLQSG